MTVVSKTRDQLVDVLRRTMDESWLHDLLQDGDSNTILYALAEVVSRFSISAQGGVDAGLITTATGGRPGTATLTVTTPLGNPGFTHPKSFKWVDDRDLVFLTAADVNVPAGAGTVDIPIQSFRQSELVNSYDDPGILASSENDATALANVQAYFEDIVCSPVIDGATDFLTAHGRERGQQRQSGESDSDFRTRIRNIQDVVSPDAIVESVLTIVQRLGLPPAQVYEPFRQSETLIVSGYTNTAPIVLTVTTAHGLQDGDRVKVRGVNDAANGYWQILIPADNQITLVSSDGTLTPSFSDGIVDQVLLEGLDYFDAYCGDTDFLDDYVSETTLVDRRSESAYFLVKFLTALQDANLDRMFFDSEFFDDPAFGYPDLTVNPSTVSALSSLEEELNRKRAAAVNFDILVDAFKTYTGLGTTHANVSTQVWSLTPPVGKIWMYIDGLFDHAPPSSITSVEFTFEDTSVTTIAIGTAPSLRLTANQLATYTSGSLKRVTKIRGLVTSDGVTNVTSVGNAKVLEMTL